ncbi:SAP30-binding protein [Microplitis demolitor]|uniref:SAP30-binding protein n=1 Tax=Microplitis demolitor TaxID=69319 RepID=UPI0004CD13BA|nr:SAP30-binding protein [Microplitis demolitor]
MSVQSSALASITAAYTDSEDEVDECIDDGHHHHHESSIPSQIIIPQNVQINKQSTPEQLNDIKNNLVLDYESDEDDVIIPPAPSGQYPPDLQEKFNHYVKLAEFGNLDMNVVIQKRKAFRNPSLLNKLIQHCNIDELGTNYPPSLYDPLKWSKESYYDQLHIAQQDFETQIENSRRNKTKVETISGVAKRPSPKNISVACTSTKLPAPTNFPIANKETSRKRKLQLNATNVHYNRPTVLRLC